MANSSPHNPRKGGEGPTTDDRRIVILYIGGEGRSGSTVLSAVLGRIPGLVSVGELRGIWQAVATNELCGCGAPFGECEFWTSVGEAAFGGWSNVDLDAVLRLDKTYARHRSIPKVVISGSRWRTSQPKELARYQSVLRSLYAAVKEVSRCPVIVDSTKDASYAFLLKGVKDVDLRVVQLVRDSRGVAYSWSKASVERPEYRHHPSLSKTFMERRSLLKAAALWDAKNVLFHVLGHFGVQQRTETYERFVSHPQDTIEQVLNLVLDQIDGGGNAIDEISERVLEGNEFDVPLHHTLGGNRVRFARGVIRLQLDEEWRRSMDRKHRLFVTLLTFPLLILYGYRRRTHA